MLSCNAQASNPLTRMFMRVGFVCRLFRQWLGVALVMAAFAVVFQVRAEVTLYQNVFEGEMVYESGEACFECHAYGPWGTPTLRFSIMCYMDGGTQTTILTARDSIN